MPDHEISQANTPPLPRMLVNGRPIPFEELQTSFKSLHAEELLRGLRLDQDNRWHMGQPIRVENYIRAFPLVSYDPDHLLVLIFGEVMLRLQMGQDPTLADYQQRFPEQADRLAELFELKHSPPALPPYDPVTLTTKTAQLAGAGHGEHLLPAIPGYEIMCPLGRGGMGVVFKARQMSLNRIVALKMILAGGNASSKQIEGFRREAELAARMQHPNIVQIFQVDSYLGHAYLTMEYIEGGSLAQKIGGQPQDQPESARLIETLAQAIHEAHRKDIIHRDLKPGNILMGSVPKIVDFGLAHVFEGDSQITTTSAYMGTPCYMAPEQAEGRAKVIGPRTDIYALGAILYELLTGQPPFRGSSPWETLEQIRTQEPPPPTQSIPNIPRDLETICLKCLQKDPARRYATAADLASDLRHFRLGEPISARPVGLLEKTYRWCRRNPGWAAMFASTAISLIVIAAVAVYGKQVAEEHEWNALVKEAAGLRTSNRPGQRFESMDVLKKAMEKGRQLNLSQDQYLRNQWIATLAVPDLFPDKPLLDNLSKSIVADFDGNLETYALMDFKGNCTIHNVSESKGASLIPAPPELGEKGSQHLPFFSRDGRFLALRYDNGLLHLYQLKTNPPTRVLVEKDVYGLDFDPHGKEVVLGHRNGTLSWYDLETGKLKKTIPLPGMVDPNVAMHPLEPLVAVWSTEKPNAQVIDLRDGNPNGFLISGDFHFPDLAWLPDGTALVASNRAGIVFHERSAMYKKGREFPTTLGPATLTFNPKGDLLVGKSQWTQEVHLINVATGQTLFHLPPTTTPLARLRFNQDGTMLAAQIKDKKLALWKVEEAPELRIFAKVDWPTPIHYHSAAVSPKSPRLLAVGMEEGLGFWDLQTGKELDFKEFKGTTRVLYEPSGDLLTCGKDGTFRWPVRMVEGNLNVGPPEPLKAIPFPSDLALSRDGKVLALSAWYLEKDNYRGGVWVQQPGKPPRVLDEKQNCNNVALSPDGRWLAVGTFFPPHVKVWDLEGKMVPKDFPIIGNSSSFSADGQWLAINGDPGGLFKVGTWEPGPSFSDLSAFSQDGKTLAVEKGDGNIQLLDIATGREFANLEDPTPAVAEKLMFIQGGRQLLTINNGPKPGIRIWDLPRIRQSLSDAGLDWDAPPFPKTKEELQAPLPTVVIEIGK